MSLRVNSAKGLLKGVSGTQPRSNGSTGKLVIMPSVRFRLLGARRRPADAPWQLLETPQRASCLAKDPFFVVVALETDGIHGEP